MKNLLILFAILLTSSIYAATFETVQDGDWSDKNTWSSGRVPKSNDIVTIKHDVNLDVSVTNKISITINSGFSLTSDISDLETKSGAYLYVDGSLRVHDLTFANGSDVKIHSTGAVRVKGNLKNKNNSDNVVIDGTLDVDGDFDNGNGGVITGSGEICTTGSYTGVGITYGYDPTSSIAAGSCVKTQILPVDLINFEANLKDGNVEISWTTASEKNNSYFEIFRSDNGLDFYSIAEVSGAGDSNEELSYDYLDVDVPTQTLYYMLKQVDFNGDFEVFDMLSVNPENLEDNCDMNINPNPCIGRCKIVFKDCFGEENKDAKFMVYDATGRLVYLSVDQKISAGEARFSFDVENNLKPAVYIVRGTASDKIINKQAILKK